MPKLTAADIKRNFWQSEGVPQNEPPPQDPTWFNERLREIGGICEEAGGRSYLQVIWGQQETCLRYGMRCIKYPAVHIRKHLIHGGSAKNIYTQQSIILSRDEAHQIYRNEPVKRLPKPEEWLVSLKEEYKVEEVGRHNWIIESLSFRNEKDWDNHRMVYGELAVAAGFEPHELIDALGPFPKNGVYGEYEVIEDEKGQYEPLTEKWLIKVQEKLAKREETINETPEAAAKRDADRVIAARDKVTEGMKQGVRDVYSYFEKQALNLPVVSVPQNYEKEETHVESTDSVRESA